MKLYWSKYKPDSLKEKTRERDSTRQTPVQYKTEDDTDITHVPLTHGQTKTDLIVHLVQVILNCETYSPWLFNIRSKQMQTLKTAIMKRLTQS